MTGYQDGLFCGKGLPQVRLCALPVIVPSSVFGEDAPSNRITIGIIGTGSQGILNLKAFLRKQCCAGCGRLRC